MKQRPTKQVATEINLKYVGNCGPEEQSQTSSKIGAQKGKIGAQKRPKRRFVSINREPALPRPLTAGRCWRSHSETERGHNRRNLSQQQNREIVTSASQNWGICHKKHCFGLDLTQSVRGDWGQSQNRGQIQVICSQVQFGLGNAEAIELLSENFSQLCFGFGSSNQSTDWQLEAETQTESRAALRYLSPAVKYK